MILTEHLKEKINQSPKSDLKTWKPTIYNLIHPRDCEAFESVLESEKPVITDELFDQLKELVKCRNPRLRLSGDRLTEATRAYIGNRDLLTYGLWVYYPWSNRMVHIPGREEFIEIRTNRNHYKISPEESEKLRTKKVGLIGLSVGQSVAVTLAMERGFGELRLADFDALELTNLNRIRTGIHNLGLSKVISVAREIMEIDPFLKLRCFTDGLTEENFDAFFTDGGDLDLLIDECDGLDMKVLSRFKARKMKIPVVMEASDRGMIDVERFDLEPDRPLLHGMIDDLNPEKLKSLKTNEDKIPYMLAIVGAETISTRAKASMLEIGETITTWPQLASAVTLGGGITADVVRRIFLNQFHASGRYYVDVETLIGDKMPGNEKPSAVVQPPTTADFGPEPINSDGIELDAQAVKNIVEAACHAPSGGNLQPWRWSYKSGTLQLKQDEALSSTFLDHNFIASYIALGASVENAVIRAATLGYTPKVHYFPDPDRKDLVAHLAFNHTGEVNPLDKFLGENIFERHTNRNIEPGNPIAKNDLDFLKQAVVANGSELILLESGNAKDEISALIAFAERFRILHPTGHKNFIEEMRWSKEEAETTRDGIDINTVDLTIDELTGFKLARDRKVIDKLVEWRGGTAFEKLSRKSTSAAAAIGIITRPANDAVNFLNAGRDMERVWIAACARGLGFQPQSPISLILQRLENRAGLNESQATQLSDAARKLRNILSPLTSNQAIFIFRLFNANRPVVRSYRRELNQHYKNRNDSASRF